MRLTGLVIALFLPCLPRVTGVEIPLEVRLISESRGIVCGKEFFVGLHLVHPPGAHTYWKYPGIVGVGTKVEWELPPGFSAGEIQWPAPNVVKMASYNAQGYEGETLLMIPITPPKNLTTASVTLAAKVSWMCCGETCHPAVKVPFSLKLPILPAPETDPANVELFGKFRRLVPRPDPRWAATVTRHPGEIILTLRQPAGIPGLSGGHFFTADGQVDSNEKQHVEVLAGGGFRLTLAATGPEKAGNLPGVVSFSGGDEAPVFVEINPAY